MAVAMLQIAEMFTNEIYDQVSEKMFGHTDMRPEEAPDGLILHSAGRPTAVGTSTFGSRVGIRPVQ
jgi:hypothetical protein